MDALVSLIIIMKNEKNIENRLKLYAVNHITISKLLS